jgi:peptidoglycan-associated lipoprotein
MSTRRLAAGFGLVLVAALAGCGSSVKLDETPVESRTPTPAAATTGQAGAGPSASTGAARPQSQVATVDLNRAPTGGGAAARADSALGRIVYFDFDSYVIKDEYRPLIDGHAKALGSDKSRRMALEGHADERGGREYNLALGQKRAEAVLKSLQLLGVSDSQLEAVSYGKERPIAEGHDEAAWAKNRRVELKDR